jgi:nitrogen fixation protein FixH
MCASLLAIYGIIYATCVWVLIRRKREGYMWHLVSSTILFLLASLQVALLVATLTYTMSYGKVVSDPYIGNYVGFENAMVAMQTAFNAIILFSL